MEHNRERGAGATAAANRQRQAAMLPRRVRPPITMTASWAAVLGGLLVLFLGVLVGTSWTDQALVGRYRRQAIERRELNEWHQALQHTNRGCAWCGSAAASPPAEGSGASAATFGDLSPSGTVCAGGRRR
ncbi:MAG: hypothetical protein JO115_13385 [Pseudonocardiales bacterium]|nr:hypothetical protein [Pseudonocardiales bacterium]